MKRNFKTIALATVLIVMMIFSSIPVFAATGTVALGVTSVSGDAGTYVLVNVTGTSTRDPAPAALSIALQYDPTKLEPQLVEVAPGPPAINAYAKLNYDAYPSGATINEAYPLSGGGTAVFVTGNDTGGMLWESDPPSTYIFQVKFLIKAGTAPGPIPLTLSVTNIADVDSVTIPSSEYTITQGEVTVNNTTPVEPTLTLTRADENNFLVSIAGCVLTNSYQIWAYEEITSDIFGGERNNNWVLKQSYLLGSELELVSGQTRSRLISKFDSVDNNYTIAVRVKNGSTFVQQLKDTFTDAAIGNIKISKVLVDGKISFDTTEVKEIKTTGSSVAFTIVANLSATYTASTTPPTTISGTGNVFTWDTTALEPGKYSVKLGAGTDTRIIPVQLYKANSAGSFGSILGMSILKGTPEGDKLKYTLTPTFEVTSLKNFQYSIGEPWRTPLFKSAITDATALTSVDNTYLETTDYGVFSVVSLIKKYNGDIDDGIVKTIVNKRPGLDADFTINVSGTGSDGTDFKPITFSATNPINMAEVQYSFWRRDAKGWVLVKDYSTDTSWIWTPSRIGVYSVQIRAKGFNAKSYEAFKTTDIEVTKNSDSKANVTNVTINSLDLEGAKARTPILISASATSPSSDPDLMYKFIISNSFIYNVETTYSLDPSYLWVPGKAGNYKVSVLVKNSESFGKYDFMKSFDVTVGQ